MSIKETNTASVEQEMSACKQQEISGSGHTTPGNTEEHKELEILSKEELINEGNTQLKEVCDKFASLPDEMILAIFKFLHHATLAKIAQVCTRWCRISNDPLFWRKAVFGPRDTVKSGELGFILARGCQELTIGTATKITYPIFTDEKPKESYALKKLNIKCSEDMRTSLELKLELQHILGRCQELTHIKINFNINRAHNSLAALAACPNLTELSFEDCRVPYEECLAIFTGCPKLEKFIPTLHDAWKSRDTVVIYSSEELWSLINYMPPLMKEITFFRMCLTLTDEHIDLLVTKAPKLTHLDLWACELLTAKTIRSVSRLSNLVDLDVELCYKISFESLCNLSACEHLKSLNVYSIVTTKQGKQLEKWFPQCKVYYKKKETNTATLLTTNISPGEAYYNLEW